MSVHRLPVVLENRRSSKGGGVRTPCTLPLDPPLLQKLERVQPLENKHTLYLIINEFDFGFSVLIIWHSGKINKEKIH